MGLGDTAAKGRRMREEREHEARERAASEADEQSRARDERHERRLARVYGVDPDAGGFSIYLAVTSVILLAIGLGVAGWSGNRSAVSMTLLIAGGTGLWALAGWGLHQRTKRVAESARAMLRNSPFPFDADDYERVAAEFDHREGWARVAVHFDPTWLVCRPELRAELADACVAFGAIGSRWADDRRLWIKSPTFPTEVSNDQADYNSARPIHVWVEQLLTRDLPGVHGAAPIQKVVVRFGFFSNGSYDVDGDDEPVADPEDED